jgi:hypothetical protein
MWRLLSALQPGVAWTNQRKEIRYPFPRLIHLVPADVGPDATVDPNKAMVVVGKNLSESGIGFYHPDPMPYSRVIASVEQSPNKWLGLLLQVKWCRFTKLGWYESGGRILRIVESPLATRGSGGSGAPQAPTP